MKKIIAIACMAWIALAGAWADNISAEDITLQKGETKTVNISLTNTESNLVSFQIDLTLPEGISINKAGCSLSNRISDPDQELAIGKQGNNVYRIASTSFALTPISGTSGTLLTLSLTASANSEGGTATLSNIRFFTSNSERVTISDTSFNIGMAITFADANVKALCVQNWDTDGDGELSEAEAAAVTDLGTVFKGNKTITSFDELQYFTGLTSIGNSAFLGCTGLTSITIPNSVNRIGNQAFENCTSLTSVTIPNSVTSIGFGAFISCSGLTSINVENGNTIYDSRDNCNAIIQTNTNTLIAGCKSTVIPNSVTRIGSDAFQYCSGLTSITIPNSVTSIEIYAFQHCSGLTSVTIGNSVTSIGSSAFNGCSGLTSITIPNSVTSIGDRAFSQCSGLTSIKVESGNTTYDSRNNCNAIIVTASNTLITGCMNTVIPNSVTSIGSNAFYYCSGLTSVTIPNSVTSIGARAFYRCTNLTTVTVGIETPLTIESATFTNRANATLYVPAGCKAAYEAADYWKEFKEIIEMEAPSPIITFADTNVKALCVQNWDTDGDGELSEAEAAAVTDLGEVFKQNATITSFDELQYFTGLTSIGDYAFLGCFDLTSVTIPNSVTSIGNYAFYYCSDLTSIKVESGNTKYDSRDNCNGIIETNTNTLITGCQNTVIPNSVTSIGKLAFIDCSGLTSVAIPNSVTSIGGYAFIGCSSLTSIVVEEGNTKYDSRNNCNAVIETNTNTLIIGCKNTVIPNSVTGIGSYAFVSNHGLTTITIPNSVTSIGNDAFYNCTSLTSVTIPNSVTSIGDYAFFYCPSLTKVSIPNSVTSIGSSAFGDCTSLTSVTVEMETPLTIDASTFTNRANATLYVPAGCKAAYEAADYWKEFKEIIEMEAPIEPTDISQLDNAIYVEPVETVPNCTYALNIKAKNDVTVLGMGFTLTLPDEFSLITDKDGIICTLNPQRASSSKFTVISSQDGNSYSFRVMPISTTTISGNDGTVLTVRLKNENAELGRKELKISNSSYSVRNDDNSYETHALVDFISTIDISDEMIGDVNSDGYVDLTDAIMIVNHSLNNTPSNFKMKVADVNGDGNIDLTDAIIVVNMSLNISSHARQAFFMDFDPE